MRSRISIRGCVCPSVLPSVRPSVGHKWVEIMKKCRFWAKFRYVRVWNVKVRQFELHSSSNSTKQWVKNFKYKLKYKYARERMASQTAAPVLKLSVKFLDNDELTLAEEGGRNSVPVRNNFQHERVVRNPWALNRIRIATSSFDGVLSILDSW